MKPQAQTQMEIETPQSNVIVFSGQSGTGKSSFMKLLAGLLEAQGYSVSCVDSKQKIDLLKGSDFVFIEKRYGTENPLIRFQDFMGLNDLVHALRGAKAKGKIGKLGKA